MALHQMFDLAIKDVTRSGRLSAADYTVTEVNIPMLRLMSLWFKLSEPNKFQSLATSEQSFLYVPRYELELHLKSTYSSATFPLKLSANPVGVVTDVCTYLRYVRAVYADHKRWAEGYEPTNDDT